MNSSSQGKQDVPCLRGKKARVDVCEMKLNMSAKIRWCRASLARKHFKFFSVNSKSHYRVLNFKQSTMTLVCVS